MIIQTDKYSNYYHPNQNYNNDIRMFITELMETECLGKGGYLISQSDNFYKDKWRSRIEINQAYLKPQENEEIKKNYSKYPGLGPLDFSLAYYLLVKDLNYNVIVLTGAMGSGKTCLCNYTLGYFENLKSEPQKLLYFPPDGIILCINFNEVSDENKEEVLGRFKLQLINRLIAEIEKIHCKTLFIDRFIAAIKKPDQLYDEFSEFARKLKHEPKKHTEESRFDFLLDWISQYNYNLSYKLNLVSQILNYIKSEKVEKQNIDFIILFDNIDRLDDLIQIDILNIIFSFSVNTPSVKIIVPMRLPTFGKIKGAASYSFGAMENMGQPPISIFENRISHFLTNSKDYSLEEKVSSSFRTIIWQRFKFISDCLKDDSNLNRLTNFFSALSGDSIRRGLYLSERFFVNSAILAYETVLYQDDFLTALLVAENTHAKLSNDDRLVTNILAGKGNVNSLLNIRILQILDFFRVSNYVCTISVLISQIKFLEEYSDEELLYSINTLNSYTKKIIYIEGVNNYTDHQNLFQSSNDIVHITYTGIEYLNTLLYNLVYIQNCFLVLNWNLSAQTRELQYLRTYFDKIDNEEIYYQILYTKELLKVKKPNISDFLAPAY